MVVDVGVGVGVAGEGVRDGVGVGVGVARQLQETLTEFIGPLKVMVSLAGQEMLAGSVMATDTCPLRGSVPPAGFTVTPGMPRLIANQVRLLLGLWLRTVTVHCLQLVRLAGETANPVPASVKCAGAADAALAPQTSSEHMTSALRLASAKRAIRLGECMRLFGGIMIVSSLQLAFPVPVVIVPVSLPRKLEYRG